MTTQEQNAWQVSLKEYVDLRFMDLQRAVDKAEHSMNIRLSAMNEFRDALKDSSAKYATRSEIDLSLKPINDELRGLRSLSDIAKGKASQTAVLIYGAISIVSLILSIVRLLK